MHDLKSKVDVAYNVCLGHIESLECGIACMAVPNTLLGWDLVLIFSEAVVSYLFCVHSQIYVPEFVMI